MLSLRRRLTPSGKNTKKKKPLLTIRKRSVFWMRWKRVNRKPGGRGLLVSLINRLKKLEETADVLGGGLGHFGLSVAGQFDRAMNVNRSSGGDQFEAIVTDPLDSIAASSSEAFKIQNKNTSFQKVTEESEKETAKNTKGLWDTQTSMLSLLENATGIGL